MNELMKNIGKLNSEIDILKKENSKLEKKLEVSSDELEQYTRRNNLCIFGVLENTNKAWKLKS